MPSEAQVRANQSNAQLSTGPKTEAGKERSSLNAVKTGLTGRTVVLPSEDRAAYEQQAQRFLVRYAPAGDRETELVQSLADTQWRLDRIPTLEMGIYALGRLEFAAQFENQPPEVRSALIVAQTYLNYQRKLSNLNLQEGRLRRQFEEDRAELQRLQDARKTKFHSDMHDAVKAYNKARENDYPFDPAEIGFDFSTEVIQAHIHEADKRMAVRTGAYFTRDRDAA